jgi:hypothetical protein
MKTTILASSAATFLVIACVPVGAQQTTGVPGSPDATTTIDGRYLPSPPPPFQGEINLNAAQSKPAWPARVVPPKGAPNILLVMTDDVGFAAPSTFGGVIPTPSLDRIAANGLRYTNFHSTVFHSGCCGVKREKKLKIHRLFGPQRAVVVEGSNALFDRYEAGTVLRRHLRHERGDRFFVAPVMEGRSLDRLTKATMDAISSPPAPWHLAPSTPCWSGHGVCSSYV